MTWFKVDDGFPDHPKVRSITPKGRRTACIGLWLACGTWSARHLTDGLIPEWVVLDNGILVQAGILAGSGLWHAPGHDCPRCGQPGVAEHLFHDWPDYQPTKAAVEERRRLRAEAGAKGGVQSGRTRRLRAVGEPE